MINFEGDALRQKHYVIASYGSLDASVLSEIEDIRRKNEEYRFVIVSPWAVNVDGV